MDILTLYVCKSRIFETSPIGYPTKCTNPSRYAHHWIRINFSGHKNASPVKWVTYVPSNWLRRHMRYDEHCDGNRSSLHVYTTPSTTSQQRLGAKSRPPFESPTNTRILATTILGTLSSDLRHTTWCRWVSWWGNIRGGLIHRTRRRRWGREGTIGEGSSIGKGCVGRSHTRIWWINR